MKLKHVFSAGILLAFLGSAILAQQGQQGNRQGRGRGGQRQNRMEHRPGDLRIGQMAPTFELSSLDGKSKYDLLKMRGEKPVVLFFGSYT
ncbi:MAG: peroxiredoxin family protein [Pirellulales bacterium]|nr:peroxiredoxin family protein [Pirellulales bacterium]